MATKIQNTSANNVNFDFTTMRGRNQIAIACFPIVELLTKKYAAKYPREEEDIRGYGNLGLSIAINEYDPKKCDNFKAFAYAKIRFTILDYITDNMFTVSVPRSAQRKSLAETGEYIYTSTFSGDAPMNDSKGSKSWFQIYGGSSTDETMIDLMNNLRDVMLEKFPEEERDVNIFADSFGLEDGDYMKGTELAVKYDISRSNVCRILEKMVDHVKGDIDLMEIMSEIMEAHCSTNYSGYPDYDMAA